MADLWGFDALCVFNTQSARLSGRAVLVLALRSYSRMMFVDPGRGENGLP